MIVEAATVAVVREVAENMRQRDIEEFMAVSHFETHRQLVDAIVERYALHQDAYAFLADDGTPVGVAGMIQQRPNVITLLFLATDRFGEIAAPLTRFVVQRLFPKYREKGVHRIECASIEGYGEVHRWLEVLGLTEETIMPGYGRDGQTFIQFAWVGENIVAKPAETLYCAGVSIAAELERPHPRPDIGETKPVNSVAAI